MKTQILTWLFILLFPGMIWAGKNQDYFSVYDLEIDGKYYSYLVDDLNDDQKPDLILIHEGEKRKRMLSIFFQHDDGFHNNADHTFEIDKRVILFDIGNINDDSYKEIVCILKEGIYYYQLDNTKYNLSLKKLLDVNSIFVLPDKYEINSWNFARDLNDDHIDDLFIPSFDGYGIYYRNEEGGYEFISKIVAPVTAETSVLKHNRYGIGEVAGAVYRTATLLFKDYNQDDRSDIICLDENNLYIYFQDKSDRFSNEPGQHAKVSVPENKKFLSLRIGGKNEEEQVAINKISDINGDGLIDIIAQKMDTKVSILNPTSQLQIYLGKKWDADTVAQFDKTPDQIVVCDGLQLDTELKDINSDGFSDLIVPSIQLGLLKIVKMLLMQRATFEILIYKADSSGRYSDKPDIKTDISLKFSFSGESTVPVNNYNDYNGDGRIDVLTSKSSEELNIYFGRRDGPFVSREPDVKFKIGLPKDGSAVKSVSLNDDKKMDLIINYDDQGNGKTAKRSLLKILIAR